MKETLIHCTYNAKKRIDEPLMSLLSCSAYIVIQPSLLSTPPAPIPSQLPQPCTVRYLVENFLDIAAVPRRSFFEQLATFATNELELEKLTEFSSAQGQDELHGYCNRLRRTALEVSVESILHT